MEVGDDAVRAPPTNPFEQAAAWAQLKNKLRSNAGRQAHEEVEGVGHGGTPGTLRGRCVGHRSLQDTSSDAWKRGYVEGQMYHTALAHGLFATSTRNCESQPTTPDSSASSSAESGGPFTTHDTNRLFSSIGRANVAPPPLERLGLKEHQLRTAANHYYRQALVENNPPHLLLSPAGAGHTPASPATPPPVPHPYTTHLAAVLHHAADGTSTPLPPAVPWRPSLRAQSCPRASFYMHAPRAPRAALLPPAHHQLGAPAAAAAAAAARARRRATAAGVSTPHPASHPAAAATTSNPAAGLSPAPTRQPRPFTPTPPMQYLLPAKAAPTTPAPATFAARAAAVSTPPAAAPAKLRLSYSASSVGTDPSPHDSPATSPRQPPAPSRQPSPAAHTRAPPVPRPPRLILPDDPAVATASPTDSSWLSRAPPTPALLTPNICAPAFSPASPSTTTPSTATRSTARPSTASPYSNAPSSASACSTGDAAPAPSSINVTAATTTMATPPTSRLAVAAYGHPKPSSTLAAAPGAPAPDSTSGTPPVPQLQAATMAAVAIPDAPTPGATSAAPTPASHPSKAATPTRRLPACSRPQPGGSPAPALPPQLPCLLPAPSSPSCPATPSRPSPPMCFQTSTSGASPTAHPLAFTPSFNPPSSPDTGTPHSSPPTSPPGPHLLTSRPCGTPRASPAALSSLHSPPLPPPPATSLTLPAPPAPQPPPPPFSPGRSIACSHHHPCASTATSTCVTDGTRIVSAASLQPPAAQALPPCPRQDSPPAHVVAAAAHAASASNSPRTGCQEDGAVGSALLAAAGCHISEPAAGSGGPVPGPLAAGGRLAAAAPAWGLEACPVPAAPTAAVGQGVGGCARRVPDAAGSPGAPAASATAAAAATAASPAASAASAAASACSTPAAPGSICSLASPFAVSVHVVAGRPDTALLPSPAASFARCPPPPCAAAASPKPLYPAAHPLHACLSSSPPPAALASHPVSPIQAPSPCAACPCAPSPMPRQARHPHTQPGDMCGPPASPFAACLPCTPPRSHSPPPSPSLPQAPASPVPSTPPCSPLAPCFSSSSPLSTPPSSPPPSSASSASASACAIRPFSFPAGPGPRCPTTDPLHLQSRAATLASISSDLNPQLWSLASDAPSLMSRATVYTDCLSTLDDQEPPPSPLQPLPEDDPWRPPRVPLLELNALCSTGHHQPGHHQRLRALTPRESNTPRSPRCTPRSPRRTPRERLPSRPPQLLSLGSDGPSTGSAPPLRRPLLPPHCPPAPSARHKLLTVPHPATPTSSLPPPSPPRSARRRRNPRPPQPPQEPPMARTLTPPRKPESFAFRPSIPTPFFIIPDAPADLDPDLQPLLLSHVSIFSNSEASFHSADSATAPPALPSRLPTPPTHPAAAAAIALASACGPPAASWGGVPPRDACGRQQRLQRQEAAVASGGGPPAAPGAPVGEGSEAAQGCSDGRSLLDKMALCATWLDTGYLRDAA